MACGSGVHGVFRHNRVEVGILNESRLSLPRPCAVKVHLTGRNKQIWSEFVLMGAGPLLPSHHRMPGDAMAPRATVKPIKLKFAAPIAD